MFILVSRWKLNLLLVFLLMASALLEILRLFISSQWVYLLHTSLPFFWRILNLYVFSQSSLAFSSLRLKIHVCGFSQEYTVATVLNRLTSHLQKFALVALETHRGKWSEWHVCERGSRTEDADGPLGGSAGEDLQELTRSLRMTSRVAFLFMASKSPIYCSSDNSLSLSFTKHLSILNGRETKSGALWENPVKMG